MKNKITAIDRLLEWFFKQARIFLTKDEPIQGISHSPDEIKELTRLCARVVAESISMEMDDFDIRYSTANIYLFFKKFANILEAR